MQLPRAIYDYSAARPFVLDRFSQRAQADRDFSVRKAAREAGLKSHVPLLWILQGKRELHARHVDWLQPVLGLDAEESRYLRLLILKQRAKTDLDRKVYADALRAPASGDSAESTSHHIEEAEIMRDPMHSAILAATQTVSGIATIADLSRHFSWMYSQWDLQAGVERLLRNGLLRLNDGKLECVYASTTTQNDRLTKAKLEYHQGVMQLAERRLLQDAPEDREFQAMALAMGRARTPKAKAMIRAFVREFETEMENEPGSDVFQISIQLVRLSAFPPNTGSESSGENVPTAEQPEKKFKRLKENL